MNCGSASVMRLMRQCFPFLSFLHSVFLSFFSSSFSFLSLFISLSFLFLVYLPPPLLSVLSFFSCVIYACLHTVSIYSFCFFFFCHCNLYQQSRCLNNANPFFIQSRVQFSTLTTIVYCHRGIHGKLGDKAQTHSVWW